MGIFWLRDIMVVGMNTSSIPRVFGDYMCENQDRTGME